MSAATCTSSCPEARLTSAVAFPDQRSRTVNAHQEAGRLPRAELVRAAAARLQEAARDGEPCEPVRDLIGATDIALAYEVQQVLTRDRLAAGAKIVGRKIGITSLAVMRQVGVDQPDFGVLFDDMLCSETEPIGMHRLIQPRAEAEIAFVLA